jgi:hypothetical protein
MTQRAPNKLTLLQKASRFTPIVCRLLARRVISGNQVVALTDEELMARSGLTRGQVLALSYTPSWAGVPFADMLAFSNACGVDFDNRDALQKHSKMMAEGSFLYLRRNKLWDSHFVHIYREFVNHTNA